MTSEEQHESAAAQEQDTLLADTMEPSALMRVAASGSVYDVQSLISASASVHGRDNSCRVSLFFVAESGHVAMIQLLLGNGTEIDAANYLNRTSLFFAAEDDRLDALILLVEQARP